MRKDQARRLRYQEKQRIQQKMINAPGKPSIYVKPSESQLNNFASKLVK